MPSALSGRPYETSTVRYSSRSPESLYYGLRFPSKTSASWRSRVYLPKRSSSVRFHCRLSHQVVVAASLAVKAVLRLSNHSTTGIALELGILLLAVGDPLELFLSLLLLLCDAGAGVSAATVFRQQQRRDTSGGSVWTLFVESRGKYRTFVILVCLGLSRLCAEL